MHIIFTFQKKRIQLWQQILQIALWYHLLLAVGYKFLTQLSISPQRAEQHGHLVPNGKGAKNSRLLSHTEQRFCHSYHHQHTNRQQLYFSTCFAQVCIPKQSALSEME